MRRTGKVVPVPHNWTVLFENEKPETSGKQCFQCGKEFREYCEMTTLHGFKYLVEPKRSIIERIYWTVAFILVYAGVSYSIYDQLWLYIRAPVLMSLDSSSTPVWDIPFPALTICSENRIRPSIFNYTEVMMRHNYSEKEKNFLQYVSIMCSLDLEKDKLEHIDTKYLNEITEEGFAACNSTFVGIGWLENEWTSDVCNILQRRLTPLGTCHTFNSVAFKHMFKETMFHGPQYQAESKREVGEIVWTPDDGYITEKQTTYPPWRISGGGEWQAALFLLKFDSNDFVETCSYGGHGFMVAVHNPVEMVTTSPTAVYVKTDHYTEISVVPKQQVTSEELRYWPPDKRGCYYSNERQLQFFQYYTRTNCDMECEANMTLAACGCVALSQPRLESTPVCGTEKQDCIILRMMHTAKSVNEDDDNMCNCLPSCSELEYDVQVNSMPRNFSMAKGKHIEDYIGSHPKLNTIAFVNVHFRSRKITAIKRVAVFGLTDFIANIGGLMGLFLGFSFLSAFEIFYFLFLRYSKSCWNDTNVYNNNTKKNHALSPWPFMRPK